MSSQIVAKSLNGDNTIDKNDIIEYTNYKTDKKNDNVKISTINIDSTDRVSESKNILGTDIFYLDTNPIDIINTATNNTDVIIRVSNHKFSVNDNIMIQGIRSTSIIVRNALTFIANSSYVRVSHKKHGLNFDTVNDMYVDITGFIGNTNNGTDYNNIPINQINGLQKIYSVASANELANNDYYYIYMDDIIANFSSIYELSELKLVFEDINGINLNLLNADFPIGVDQLHGYHTINSITSTTITILLKTSNNINIYNRGGSNVWLAKINEFTEGYIANNFYKIPFKKTFRNVSKIKLISTEFPNTEKVIKTVPEKSQNNKFYWKLQNEGLTEYYIELDAGNYTVDLLKTSLTEKINKIQRESLKIINLNTTDYYYDEYHKCLINIESKTDTFSITFLTTLYIGNAITYEAGTNYSDGLSRLIINHPNHRLIAGVDISFNNATATNAVPASILNTTFTIEKIIDENTYQLILDKFNSDDNTDITNGGDSMNITFPVKSQLYFDKNDTIGDIIGYRHSGKPNSITKYNFTNTNKLLYQNDFILDNTYVNNSINLSGNNYILMTSPLFTDSYNSGPVSNIFAKLLLSGEPGTILFNQFIQMGEYFDPVKSEISEWEVSFYNANGELYNFGNLNHSYTLEIHELIK